MALLNTGPGETKVCLSHIGMAVEQSTPTPAAGNGGGVVELTQMLKSPSPESAVTENQIWIPGISERSKIAGPFIETALVHAKETKLLQFPTGTVNETNCAGDPPEGVIVMVLLVPVGI